MKHFLYLFSKSSISCRVNAEWTRLWPLCSLNKTSNGDIIITLSYCKLPAYPIKKAFRFLQQHRRQTPQKLLPLVSYTDLSWETYKIPIIVYLPLEASLPQHHRKWGCKLGSAQCDYWLLAQTQGWKSWNLLPQIRLEILTIIATQY